TVQKQSELPSRNIDTLVVRRPKPTVRPISDQLDVRELQSHHLGRAVGGGVVHHDHLVVRLNGSQALSKFLQRVVADYDHAHSRKGHLRFDATIFAPMSNEILLTPEGHEKLKKELEELKGPTRMRI